jgi:nucleoside-diphosphate-sugar epimerase
MKAITGKILITGGTGLVGSRLIPRLVTAGYDCRALSRAGRAVAGVADTTEGDLLDPGTLDNGVRGISAIVHLAAVFRSPDPALIWKSNFEGTKNLIELAKRQVPDTHFIMASTAHVYNSNNPHPGRESDTTNPEHPYPASKVAAEKLVRESGLKWSIIRFPFVYGDGDGHLEALPKHVGQWHPAKRMSTIHHRDIFTAIELALDNKFQNRTVNISDEAPISIFELLSLSGTTLSSSAEPLTNPWHLVVDSTLARSLGFQPVVRTVYQARQEGLI